MPPRLTTKIEFNPKASGVKGADAHCMSVRRLILEDRVGPRQTIEIAGYGADYEGALLNLLDAVCAVGSVSTFAADTMAAAAEQVPLAYILRAQQKATDGSPVRVLLDHALNGTLARARQAAENLEASL